MLAGIDGAGDIALTTSGELPAGKAWLLAAAGLRRVTVSLESRDDAVCMALNDAAFPVAGALDAIAAAAGAGLPVKVNMVVKRGCNDQSVLPMTEHFRLIPAGRALAGKVIPPPPARGRRAGPAAPDRGAG